MMKPIKCRKLVFPRDPVTRGDADPPGSTLENESGYHFGGAGGGLGLRASSSGGHGVGCLRPIDVSSQ